MNKKIKLLSVFPLIFMFSCMAQAPQVINPTVIPASPSPLISASIVPSQQPSTGSTNYPTIVPTLSPTNPPVNYLEVWSAVTGSVIVDSRNSSNRSYYLTEGLTDSFNTLVFFNNNSDNDISFSSTNPDIVSVDNKGNISANKAGTGQIIISSKQDPAVSVKIDFTIVKAYTPNGGSGVVGQTGGTGGPREMATFNGRVYDYHGKIVDGAVVSARVLDTNHVWVGDDQVTVNGAYIFRNAPIGAVIQITVSKPGWTTQTRYEVTKSNLQGDPTANVYDFGGIDNQILAIQDEPEITNVKLNGLEIDSQGITDRAFDINYLEFINGDKPFTNTDNFQFIFEFSEPVDRSSFQNSVRLVSQKLLDINGSLITSDETGNIVYNWSNDDQSVNFDINHKLIVDNKSNKANYLFSFTGIGFKDKAGNEPNKGKYFDFKNSIYRDFFVFKVIN